MNTHIRRPTTRSDEILARSSLRRGLGGLCLRGALLVVPALVISGCPEAATTPVLDEDPDDDPAPFDVALSGDEEVPPVDTDATGDVTVTVEDNRLRVTGAFSDLSSPLTDVSGTPAHIHEAPPGENGPIVFPIEVTPGDDDRSGTFDDTFTLTDEQLNTFEAGNYYLNVHSEDHPGGELRVQLVGE